MLHLVGPNKASLGVVYLMCDPCASGIGRQSGVNVHLSAVACPDGQVGKVCLGHCHQRHIAEDTHSGPVVKAVKFVCTMSRIDTHCQLLRPLFTQVWSQVKDACIVCRLP